MSFWSSPHIKGYRISNAGTGSLDILEDQQLIPEMLPDFEVWFDLSFIADILSFIP